MAAPASREQAVVSIDFGTSHSGFAFAHRSEPDRISSFYDWPSAGKVGGKPYCKTQTSLLYSPDEKGEYQLRGWGWEALVKHGELYACSHKRKRSTQPEQGKSKHLFITKFKLQLAGQAFKFEEIKLPSGFSTIKLVSDYLRCLTEFIMVHLRGCYGKDFSKRNVKWCLTVPAIWNEAAKQAMCICAQKAGMVQGAWCTDDEASVHKLEVVLEPEAASFYCQSYLKSKVHLKPGDMFLVADIGGGTIDVVVHKKCRAGNNLEVDEVVASTGELGGGAFVDRNFFSLLKEKIGCFEEFVEKEPKASIQILNWWLSHGGKNTFDGSEGFSTEWELPRKLSSAWQDYDRQRGIELEEEHYETVELDTEDMKKVFDPEIDKVIRLIQDKMVLRMKYVMLVGGFSSNPYLVQRAKRALAGQVEDVLVPSNPGAAICNGAVLMGFRAGLVRSRIAKKTYGVVYNRTFKKGDREKKRYVNSDGEVMLADCFLVFVRKGQSVSHGHCVKRVYTPGNSGQKTFTLQLYSSTSVSPQFVTDKGCVEEGLLSMDISQDLHLDMNRKVEISMYFGESVVRVCARRANFGDTTRLETCYLKFDSSAITRKSMTCSDNAAVLE